MYQKMSFGTCHLPDFRGGQHIFCYAPIFPAGGSIKLNLKAFFH